MTTKEISVVGAAIVNGSKVLAMQRSEAMSLAGFWEFPGGKIEAGESAKEALIREIKEELGVEIELIDYLNEYSYGYDFGIVSLKVYTAKIISGAITLHEHSAKKWLSADNIMSVNWAPVDIPAVQLLSEQLV